MLGVHDIFAAFLCFIILDRILVWRIKKYKDSTRKLFIRGFRFRIVCAVAFSLVTAYYYKGGDSEMFLYATQDIQTAIQADALNLSDLLFMENALDDDPLFYYFDIDNMKYPVSGFMRHPANFMVPKLGLIPYLLFFKSYIAMCFIFSFFALAGSIRLYKLFMVYFPKMKREIALAVLFIPSAVYWSSGFLKDTICFGAVGFLLYGVYQVFIAKKKILPSLFWIALSSYLIYTIKAYILLALIPGLAFWIFGAMTSGIKTPSLRILGVLFSIIIAGAGALYLVNYLTSDVNLARYSMDNLLESSDYSRQIFERRGDEGSNFQINTSNPALLMLNGLVATFFRPFPWEVSSGIVAFSAIESILMLSLFTILIFKAGIGKVIKSIFASPLLLLCFSFAIVFAVSVGISTTNFGSLSRYKIPCLPFYLMFVLGAYQLTGITYPKWMEKILVLVGGKKNV